MARGPAWPRMRRSLSQRDGPVGFDVEFPTQRAPADPGRHGRSCSRPSTSSHPTPFPDACQRNHADGRDKPGHDGKRRDIKARSRVGPLGKIKFKSGGRYDQPRQRFVGDAERLALGAEPQIGAGDGRRGDGVIRLPLYFARPRGPNTQILAVLRAGRRRRDTGQMVRGGREGLERYS